MLLLSKVRMRIVGADPCICPAGADSPFALQNWQPRANTRVRPYTLDHTRTTQGDGSCVFLWLIPGEHGDSPSVSLVPGETAGTVPMFAFMPYSSRLTFYRADLMVRRIFFSSAGSTHLSSVIGEVPISMDITCPSNTPSINFIRSSEPIQMTTS